MTIELIAEIGSVHDGSFGNAMKAIELAKSCGATAVKFQTHIAEAETLKSAPSPVFFQEESRFDYFRRTGFSLEQWIKLRKRADELSVEMLSSPFSLEAVDLLEAVGVRTYKIPSGEVTNLPLLERVAATKKRVLLSSGMSTWRELDQAVEILRGAGDLIVFQCSSRYPCEPEAVGLNVLAEMRQRYGIPVGFSDHTVSNTAAIAAATLGAVSIEKHLTFSKHMYGSDAKNSAEPEQFSALASSLREIGVMLANPVDKDDMTPYREMKRVFEKSLVTMRPLQKGETLDLRNIGFKKPGSGISASLYKSYLGRRAARELPADHLLSDEDLE